MGNLPWTRLAYSVSHGKYQRGSQAVDCPRGSTRPGADDTNARGLLYSLVLIRRLAVGDGLDP